MGESHASLLRRHPELSNPTKKQRKNEYTADWSQRSESYKEKQGWRCEECGDYFSDRKNELHTHHINAIKYDNREENLKALCEECHAKQHTHRSVPLRERIKTRKNFFQK